MNNNINKTMRLSQKDPTLMCYLHVALWHAIHIERLVSTKGKSHNPKLKKYIDSKTQVKTTHKEILKGDTVYSNGKPCVCIPHVCILHVCIL